jgi:uncharacterized membrane protein
MSNENAEIVIAVFAGEDKAKAVLKEIEATATSEVDSLHQQVTVLSLDAEGKLSVKKPTKQQHTGAATGALVGVLVGAALGLPIVGAVLGGIVGARQAGKKQTSGQDFSLDQVIELMMPNSSIVVAEVEDWRVGPVMSNLEMRGATLVLHASEAELTQAIANAEGSSAPEA